MKIFQKMCASTVIITTLLGIGGTVNSVHADSIEQQSKLGIDQETDTISNERQSTRRSFGRISRCNIHAFIHICKSRGNRRP